MDLSRALIAVAITATSAHAAAQPPEDLGRLAVHVPADPMSQLFVILTVTPLPETAPESVPAAARDPLARMVEARTALLAAVARARAATSEGELASAHRTVNARGDALASASEVVRALLEPSLETLTPPALLLLGSLRLDVAADAYHVALDAYDACTAAGRADCVVPTLASDDAIAAWMRVPEGSPEHVMALGAIVDTLEVSDARVPALIEQALAIDGIAPALEADLAYRLGEARAEAGDRAGALAAYRRCARVATHALAAPAALHVASLLDPRRLDEIATTLAPFLDDVAHGDAVRDVAAQLVARAGRDGPRRLSSAVPAALRARLFALGAARLADQGNLAWAEADLSIADHLAPDPAIESELARVRSLRASSRESPAGWAERAAVWCLDRTRDWPGGSIAVRASRAASHLHVDRPLTGALADCLARDAPPPEVPLSHPIRASITPE